MKSFFPFVRLLERSVGLDRIRFSHPPDFTFPAGEISSVQEAEDGAVELTTTFLGLLGAESPLPAAVSEEVLFEDATGALQAFFDVFHDRALHLLYGGWKRFAPRLAGTGDSFHAELLSLMGIDSFCPYAPDDDGRTMDPAFALGLSDFARCDPEFLGEKGLEAILRRTYPELAPRVVEGQAVRVDAADEDRTALGERGSMMGVDATFGGGATDLQGSVCIAVGPVDAGTYENLMPGGARYQELGRFVEHWTASRVRVELEVTLQPSAEPSLSLGTDYGATMGQEARIAGSASDAVRVRVRLAPEANSLATRRYVDA